MRMARLLEMIRVIKYHPDWGAKRLAEYFEISEKRVYDDINELNAANIPIVYNGRGYSFLTPPTLVPVQFTVDEAMALMLSGTALEGGRGDAYAAAVRTATTKLLDSLPEDTRQFLLALSGRVRAKGQTAAPDALKKLHRAMAGRRAVAFEYASYSSGRRAAREADRGVLARRGDPGRPRIALERGDHVLDQRAGDAREDVEAVAPQEGGERRAGHYDRISAQARW